MIASCRNNRWGLLLAAISLWFVGCSSEPTDERSVLIYGRGADADYLDPISTSNGETAKVLVNIFDTLITYDDKTQELVPSLATSWTKCDDELTYTFQLREDVKFHDGPPLDA
jgi:peptide/nickel transport system substrate-binding protein